MSVAWLIYGSWSKVQLLHCLCWVYLSFGLYLGGLVFYINTRNLEADILLGVVSAWIAHEIRKNCMLSLHARK